ncbi:CheR family methyltransferase [Pantanalinema rosaneae CENA516]|uniref:CheR family methyltransferase n=1 Tax=Pantanalinema rosaneae TaxID=1620701 RepID=UPI003D6EC13B
MDSFVIPKIIALIVSVTGLQIRERDQELLQRKLRTRMRMIGVTSFEEYYQRLQASVAFSDDRMAQPQAISSEQEWRELLCLLTTTESYFFRDKGQFLLLKEQILPEIIRTKQQLIHQPFKSSSATPISEKPALRVWSAGCSTGEEAYSIAILLQELIPNWQDWHLLVLGTDINQTAIAAAQRGFYSHWSFRDPDPSIRNQYFREHRDGWEIMPKLREIVSFQYGNLVQDSIPNITQSLHNIDLIVCRNVFIYFDPHAIATVLKKFYNTLLPQGYLVTGHTELYDQDIDQFQVRVFPQSVAYQKAQPAIPQPTISQPDPLNLIAPVPSSPVLLLEQPRIDHAAPCHPAPLTHGCDRLTSVTETTPTNLATIFAQAEQLFANKAYLAALKMAEQVMVVEPNHFQAHCLTAQAYANLGAYCQAEQVCRQAIQINPLAIDPYYLMAQIAEEKGDLEGAKFMLKRIIYLDPGAVDAYLELGSLYERERNSDRARKVWASVLDVIQRLDTNAFINRNQTLTVSEVRQHVERLINQ